MAETPNLNDSERPGGPSAAAGKSARRGGGSIAAIHVLKARLAMGDDDYRALLFFLTGKNSASDMAEAERQRVRDHLQRLAVKMGVAKPVHSQRNTFAQAKAAASPMERKVWALWKQLGRDGRIQDTSAAALNAYVKRQTGMDALRFCDWAQLSQMIEALKRWGERP